MSGASREKLIDHATALTHAMFASPLWDSGEKKWHRLINLDTGNRDKDQHFYYDICNIYALGRAMAMAPEMDRFKELWLQAATWLFWLVNSKDQVGYTSFEIANGRDLYSFALASGALSEAYIQTKRPALLRKASELHQNYLNLFPQGKVRNVQASNHFILSAISLHKATGENHYLDLAVAEVEHLLSACRILNGSEAGCFTDDHRLTAFPRHVYGTWALVEVDALRPDQRYKDACIESMEWWRRNQLADGGFHFFYDTIEKRWVDPTVYSVHQKGMFLLSAWAINKFAAGAYDQMIERAMATCDSPQWEFVSPQGWKLYRRSNQETSVVYSYEVGWEVLGHLFGIITE